MRYLSVLICTTAGSAGPPVLESSSLAEKHCRPLARRKESHWFISSSDCGFPLRWERWFILLLSFPVLLSSAQSAAPGALWAHLLPGSQLYVEHMIKRSQMCPHPLPLPFLLLSFTPFKLPWLIMHSSYLCSPSLTPIMHIFYFNRQPQPFQSGIFYIVSVISSFLYFICITLFGAADTDAGSAGNNL